MRMKYKNQWGTEGSGLDQQRPDLFRVCLNVPVGGLGAWENAVEFALEAFPFPEDKITTYDIKFMQQTNHMLGGDTPTAPVTIPVRYAFAQPTAQLLYRWWYLIKNPRTGTAGLTSAVKCSGTFKWLIPNMTAIANVDAEPEDGLKVGLEYVLEGCLITGIKPTDANHTQTNAGVNLSFDLLVDRYYPKNIGAMVFKSDMPSGASTITTPIGNVG